MNHEASSRFRRAGLFGVIGGVVVIVGTYWVSWFSLKGYNGHSFGGSTLYQLQKFTNGGWNSYASQVMIVGAILLLAGGIAAIFGSSSKMWELSCAVGMAFGAAIVLFASIKTGMPHWFTHEPLYFSRGLGEWFCLAGAIVGFVGCVLALLATSMGAQNQVDVAGQESLPSVS